jgi:hypothetical protein
VKRPRSTIAGLAVALSLAMAVSAQDGGPLVVTRTPPQGEGGSDQTDIIAGKVTVACDGCSIVLFAKGGDTWYVQPRTDDFYTLISDSQWQNETHLGSEYLVLLTKPGYVPPLRTNVLPKEGELVVAALVIPGRK